MKLSIIPEDLIVTKDGESYKVNNLSYLDANIHAIQWQDTTGEIEYKDTTPNLVINDITPYNQCVTDWETAKNTANPTLTDADYQADLRNQRNYLLSSTDWTQIQDNKLSDTKKTEWQTYRQSLRDLPANTSDYKNPVWPTQPS